MRESTELRSPFHVTTKRALVPIPCTLSSWMRLIVLVGFLLLFSSRPSHAGISYSFGAMGFPNSIYGADYAYCVSVLALLCH